MDFRYNLTLFTGLTSLKTERSLIKFDKSSRAVFPCVSEFNKGHFRKDSLSPICKTCGARTRMRDETGIHWTCNICSHPVNDEGECVAAQRCVPCKGRPKCENCGLIAEEVSKGNFRCASCNHILDDDGHCVEYPCYSCNPYTYNNCDGRLEGGLDDDGEIHCENCDHYVDEEGSCVSSEFHYVGPAYEHFMGVKQERIVVEIGHWGSFEPALTLPNMVSDANQIEIGGMMGLHDFSYVCSPVNHLFARRRCFYA